MATADVNDWGALGENPRSTIDNTTRVQNEARTMTGQLRDATSKVNVQREHTERALRQQYRQTQAGQFADRQMTRTSAGLRQYSASATAQGKKKRAKAAKYAAARVKVTAANAWINSWVLFWYMAFQLPMAVVSTAALGITYVVYSYLDTLTTNEDGTFTGTIAAGITKVFLTVAEYILFWSERLFNIFFDPTLLFIAPFALVFLLGLFQLILCWFIYALLGIKSLSGQAAGVKITMFLVAMIGIMIPILNIFPLILLWTGTVWLKPR